MSAVPSDEQTLPFDFTPRKPQDTEPRPLTVAELDLSIKGALDDSFTNAVWVEGEVADARPAPSGHLYFCLKDEEGGGVGGRRPLPRQRDAADARALRGRGARPAARGRPTFWAPRGRLQLVADRMQAAGRGAILEALERLKAKLTAEEWLFAPERKRAIPREPRIVGVVTSRTGAVIHDICRVAFRRGGARILLAAAKVQGAGAAESICNAPRADRGACAAWT